MQPPPAESAVERGFPAAQARVQTRVPEQPDVVAALRERRRRKTVRVERVDSMEVPGQSCLWIPNCSERV
jgi:hypothetical protein